MTSLQGSHVTLDETRLSALLQNDEKVKVAGVDADGVLRGKIMSKDKFLSSVSSGFGMSSAIFAWDIHDVLFTTETSISTSESGFADLMAVPDINSFRRLPSEENIPFFFLRYLLNDRPVFACPRGIISLLCEKLARSGYRALAGGMSRFLPQNAKRPR